MAGGTFRLARKGEARPTRHPEGRRGRRSRDRRTVSRDGDVRAVATVADAEALFVRVVRVSGTARVRSRRR